MKIYKVKPDYTKHYIYQDIGLIRGYTLTNETAESETLILNDIRITINLSSTTGAEFYKTIKDKFRPEKLKAKYITSTNYIYAETQTEDIIKLEIKILTDRNNPKEVKAKKKLLYRINKYT